MNRLGASSNAPANSRSTIEVNGTNVEAAIAILTERNSVMISIAQKAEECQNGF